MNGRIAAFGMLLQLGAPAVAGPSFNYDLQLNELESARRVGGLFEFEGFSPDGALTTNFFAEVGATDADRVVRLDTTWKRDDPGRRAVLRLGDTVARAGSWGRGLRLGGVQWGSNSAAQTIAFPHAPRNGEAVVPSFHDLYVEHVLRSHGELPIGPSDRLRALTGAGEVKLSMSDALGKERVIAQRYHAGPSLLREGLSEYQYDVGFVREDYGFKSAEYGRPLATATHRLGLTERLTREFYGELSAKQQTAGAGIAYSLPVFGTLSAGYAGSHNAGALGHSLSLGIERQGPSTSFGLHTQVADSRFAQAGFSPDRPGSRQTTVARFGVSPRTTDSLSFGYIGVDEGARKRTDILAASYSRPIASNVSVTAFASRALTSEREQQVSIALSHQLGSGTAATRQRTSSPREYAHFAQQFPPAGGIAYGGVEEPEWRDQSAPETQAASVDAPRSDGESREPERIGSGLTTRSLNEPPARIEIGNYPHVRVHAKVLSPRRPGMRPEDFPLETEFASLQLAAAPDFRTSADAEWPTQPARAALLKVRLADGGALPPGAKLRVSGSPQTYAVGLHGEAYVEDLDQETLIYAQWGENRCSFRAIVPSALGPADGLGPHVCS